MDNTHHRKQHGSSKKITVEYADGSTTEIEINNLTYLVAEAAISGWMSDKNVHRLWRDGLQVKGLLGELV